MDQNEPLVLLEQRELVHYPSHREPFSRVGPSRTTYNEHPVVDSRVTFLDVELVKPRPETESLCRLDLDDETR